MTACNNHSEHTSHFYLNRETGPPASHSSAVGESFKGRRLGPPFKG